MYACCLAPGGPTDKENQVKIYTNTGLGILPLWSSKDPDPDPYQSKKSDPDPYQSEKPDPYQNGLNPQHWFLPSLEVLEN
jgi:hypothetical protein